MLRRIKLDFLTLYGIYLHGFEITGFELELYSTHEYKYVFWYLYELVGWLVSCLNRADSYLQSNIVLNAKNVKKNKNHKKNTCRLHKAEILFNQALQNICGGFYKCMIGLMKDGKIFQPHPKFDNEKIRFEHRFAPFAELSTPPPMSYLDFKRMEHQVLKISQHELYYTAAKHFQQAKAIIEAISKESRCKLFDVETQNLLKTCKFNSVVCNLLANGHKSESRAAAEFDFTIHKCFPILKIL